MATNGATALPRTFGMYGSLFAQRTVANNAPHLTPHLKPDSRILDVGCGIGFITMDLAKRVPSGFVFGFDFDGESIAKAREAAQAAGIRNIQFEVGDATDLSAHEADSFDIAHVHQVLLHLPHPVKALKEIRRVLKPGGIVASRDLAYKTTVPFSKILEQDQQRAYALNASRGADHLGGLVNHMWMHEAGFSWENIETGGASWEWSTLEDRRAHTVGTVASAQQRGESEEYVSRLKKAKDEWAEKPEGRLLGLDSWVIGRK